MQFSTISGSVHGAAVLKFLSNMCLSANSGFCMVNKCDVHVKSRKFGCKTLFYE